MTELDRLTQALSNRYVIEREVGVGGMATVYLGRDIKNDRQVALKVLRPDIASTLGVERFLREIKTAAKLNHPHIMPLLDSGEADGFLYYTMPYIEGESLAERIDREGQLPLEEAREIVREVADGMGYAHGQGVIHRDIKPENIMLSGGHAVIADFGVAKAVTTAGGTRLTETGIAIGTVTYMSPEQASGDGSLDARSDIYSLGCVLYESLAGQPPFLGESPQAVMARHAVDPVPPLRTVRSNVSGELEAIVAKALDKVPADRFQSAEQFARALSGEYTVTPTETAAQSGSPRWRIVAVAAVLVAAVGGVIFMNGRGDGQDGMASEEFRLAVLPFDIQSPDESDAYLTRGLMNLLGMYLDGTGRIHVVDQATVLGALGAADPSALTPDGATAVAGRLGAGRYLIGSLLSVDDQFTLDASLYNASDSGPPTRWTFTGPQTRLDSLVAELALSVVAGMGAGGEGRLASVGASTRNWTAQKAYLQGVDHMYVGHYDSAVVAFENAVAEDPVMADAWYMLSWAYEWNDPGDVRGYGALDSALAHVDHARGRNRDVIRAQHAFYFGDAERAERIMLDVVAREPDWAEAWHILGQVREFSRWQGSGAPEPALEAYQTAYRLHPGDLTLLWHYTWALRNHRQWGLVDSIYQAAVAAGRKIGFPEVQDLFRALVQGTPDEREAALGITDQIGAANPHAMAWVLSWLLPGSDSLRIALAMSQSLAEDGNVPEVYRAFGHTLSGQVNVNLGNWTSARASFLEGARLEPVVMVEPVRGLTFGVPLFEHALTAAVPYLEVPRSELESLMASVENWTPPPFGTDLRNLSVETLTPFRTYLVGLLHARLGENEEALQVVTELETLDLPKDSIGLFSDLALEIRALLAAEQGRLEEAVDLLDSQSLKQATLHGGKEPRPYRPFGRLLRAEYLAALGRNEEALGWYEGFPSLLNDTMWEATHLSHIYGRMGQIYDELGEREKAIEYYTRFVTRWQDADAKFQPRVDSARTRLAELQ